MQYHATVHQFIYHVGNMPRETCKIGAQACISCHISGYPRDQAIILISVVGGAVIMSVIVSVDFSAM
jgi:hypothetical protein